MTEKEYLLWNSSCLKEQVVRVQRETLMYSVPNYFGRQT